MPATGDAFGGRTLVGEKNYYAWYQTTAAGDGVWMDFRGVRSATLHITALAAGDSFVVQVSNAVSKPANTVDGVTSDTVAGDATAKHQSITKLPCNWIKVDKTGSTATASADLHGITR